jgi:hypothetical protein
MRTRLFFFVCILFGATPAYSADEAGHFSIQGAGLLTCEFYVKERSAKSSAYVMIGGWLDGYITGRNQLAPDTFDATSFESIELLTWLMEDYCKDHPKAQLFSVINTILLKINDTRIRQKSPLVVIRHADREARLYQEVISRSQKELKKRDHYHGEIDGKFGESTLDAIAAFQKEQKLKPTGFPDQKTLWQLLRGSSRAE